MFGGEVLLRALERELLWMCLEYDANPNKSHDCSAGAADHHQGSQATKPKHPIGRGADTLDHGRRPTCSMVDTDPIAIYAPNRTNAADFYQGSQVGEGLTKPNDVIEDGDPDPGVIREISVLDTVYESVGGQLGSTRPVMTVFHGGTRARSTFRLPVVVLAVRAQIAIADCAAAVGPARENVPARRSSGADPAGAPVPPHARPGTSGECRMPSMMRARSYVAVSNSVARTVRPRLDPAGMPCRSRPAAPASAPTGSPYGSASFRSCSPRRDAHEVRRQMT
jgi:hypothetical protein